MKVEDMDFSTPFELTMKTDGFVDGLVSFFSVDFSKCHKRVFFSTGPAYEYTHWKQTVFYLKGYTLTKQGDCIYGDFAMKPSNEHDLDIKIKVRFKSDEYQLEEENSYTMCYNCLM